MVYVSYRRHGVYRIPQKTKHDIIVVHVANVYRCIFHVYGCNAVLAPFREKQRLSYQSQQPMHATGTLKQ